MVAFLWAWLVVTSNLQTAVPQLVAVAQGKLADDTSSEPARGLRKIQSHASVSELYI
jgi:hypothetical protein